MAAGDSTDYLLGRLTNAVEDLGRRIDRSESTLLHQINAYRSEGAKDRLEQRAEFNSRFDDLQREHRALSQRLTHVERPSLPPPPPPQHPDATGRNAAQPEHAAATAARWGAVGLVVSPLMQGLGGILIALLTGALVARGCMSPTAGATVGGAAAAAGSAPRAP